MAIKFYVSANKGSDNNSGTIDSPFKTINYAIQQAIQKNDPSGAIIQLEKEIYYLDQTITIQNYKNPISIVGLGQAPTQIIAGVPCDAYISQFGKKTRSGYDIYQIALPNWNTGQFTMRGTGSSPGAIGYTQPVIAGQLYQMSRYPKPSNPDQKTDWLSISTVVNPQTFTFQAQIPTWTLTSSSNYLIHGFWGNAWADEYLQITNYDASAKKITLNEAPTYPLSISEARFEFLNIMDEMVPGEYTIDINSQKIYFVPISTDALSNSYVTHLNIAFNLSNVNQFSMSNLTFFGSQGIGFSLKNCNQFQFKDVNIQYCGTDGINISGGINGLIQDSEFSFIGDNAIKILAGVRTSLTSCNHLVQNCRFHEFSNWVRSYTSAVNMKESVGVTVRGGRMYNSPHAAIFCGGNNNVISNVIFHDTCQQTGDVGVIYQGRNWTYQGQMVDNCYFYNMGNKYGRSNCVYLDDLSGGMTVKDCIAQNVDTFLLLGGGRVNNIENCLIVNANAPIRVDSRGLDNDADKLVSWGMYTKLNAMPYTQSPWKDEYPLLANIMNENPPAPMHNTIQHMVLHSRTTAPGIQITTHAANYVIPTQIYTTHTISSIPFTNPNFASEHDFTIDPTWPVLSQYGINLNAMNLKPYEKA